MCTKCVSTVPLGILDDDFQLKLKNYIGYIRGTMCTKYVSTVPPGILNCDFQ